MSSSAAAAVTAASAPRQRSPARDANWNQSGSMSAVFNHTQLVTRTERAKRDEPRNPNDKAVCAPNAQPILTKRHAIVEKSMIFADMSHGQTSHRVIKTSMHTDPFDVSRQSAQPRPMYPSYGTTHQQPHPAGRCHLRDFERDSKGFVSPTGCVSYGGRRHTNCPTSQSSMCSSEVMIDAPQRSPLRRRVVSPVSGMSANFPMCTGSDARAPLVPRSPLRRRSPARDQPTLQGVLKPDPKPKPIGLISKPVWSLGEDNGNRVSGSSGTGSCAPLAPVAAVNLPNGASDTTVVKQRKHYVSNRVVVAAAKAPFHTTTPRQPAGQRLPIKAPYC